MRRIGRTRRLMRRGGRVMRGRRKPETVFGVVLLVAVLMDRRREVEDDDG